MENFEAQLIGALLLFRRVMSCIGLRLSSPSLVDEQAIELWLAELSVDFVVRIAEPLGELVLRVESRRRVLERLLKVGGAPLARKHVGKRVEKRTRLVARSLVGLGGIVGRNRVQQRPRAGADLANVRRLTHAPLAIARDIALSRRIHRRSITRINIRLSLC